MEELEELLQEAFHSYQLYLECSGSLDVSGATIYLFKWPDVAKTSLDVAKNPNDLKSKILLKHELQALVVEPVRVIHDAAIDRLAQLSKNHPARAEKIACEAKSLKYQDSIKSKKLLIESINSIFTTINVMTDVDYPTIQNRKV